MTEQEKARLRTLADKYLKNTISDTERAELEAWFLEQQDEPLEILGDFARDEEELERRIFQTVQARTGQQARVRKLDRWPRIAVAASILLALGAGTYFALHQKEPVQQIAQHDVAPFSKQAILKTGHGSTIVLNHNTKGLLAQYANTHINQSTGEQIAYTNQEPSETAVFDTLQIPAGGRPYHLKLADGSAVTVNVASALRFPENFRKNNNEIELIAGEAYFSIKHNASSPLIIKAARQVIEDVGTEFNVNTYSDEPESRTTLVEGAITVNHKGLAPGQQAILAGTNLTIATADLMQTLAWKKGDFVFNGENIRTVMRELARWYNIEVSYQGSITETGFYIRISRSKNISEVLKMLERTGKVHFKIEGRRVTVYSKK